MPGLDLFNQVVPSDEIDTYLRKYLSQEWIDFIGTTNAFAFACLIKDSLHAAKSTKKKLFPSLEEMFKPFNMIKPDQVKVMIISKCPYPNDNADGIAFSCKKYITPSLRHLFHALTGHNYPKIIERDTHFPYATNLQYLCKQGVLLTNVKLLVTENDADSLSHLEWTSAMGALCSKISRNDPEIPFLFLGSDAEKLRSHVSRSYYKLSCDHPVNAERAGYPWACDSFEEINRILRNHGKEEIKWTSF